jgi:hypothetical protein
MRMDASHARPHTTGGLLLRLAACCCRCRACRPGSAYSSRSRHCPHPPRVCMSHVPMHSMERMPRPRTKTRIRMHAPTVVICMHVGAAAHATTAAFEGTTSACAPFPRMLMEYLQHKAFATIYVQNRWNIYNICVCNICNIQIKCSQHTFETAETFETYTCN